MVEIEFASLETGNLQDIKFSVAEIKTVPPQSGALFLIRNF